MNAAQVVEGQALIKMLLALDDFIVDGYIFFIEWVQHSDAVVGLVAMQEVTLGLQVLYHHVRMQF